MAKPKGRTSEIHFYEWYISRWQTSEAHDELDALGRGIYREMLDICYAQGSVSSDPQILSRRCACTTEELAARWDVLRKHFTKDRHNPERLVNQLASLFRRNFFEYVTKQKQNGAKGGKRKPNGDRELGSDGLAVGNPTLNPPCNPDHSQEGRMKNEELLKGEKEAVGNPVLPKFELDETWQPFVATWHESGFGQCSDVDWSEARTFGWNRLDFESKLAATKGLRDRAYTSDDPAKKSLPKNYLQKQMWNRGVQTRNPPRPSEYPER